MLQWHRRHRARRGGLPERYPPGSESSGAASICMSQGRRAPMHSLQEDTEMHVQVCMGCSKTTWLLMWPGGTDSISPSSCWAISYFPCELSHRVETVSQLTATLKFKNLTAFKDHLHRDLKISERDFEGSLIQLIHIIKETTHAQRRGLSPRHPQKCQQERNGLTVFPSRKKHGSSAWAGWSSGGKEVTSPYLRHCNKMVRMWACH